MWISDLVNHRVFFVQHVKRFSEISALNVDFLDSCHEDGIEERIDNASAIDTDQGLWARIRDGAQTGTCSCREENGTRDLRAQVDPSISFILVQWENNLILS